jgi:hypothetical protein
LSGGSMDKTMMMNKAIEMFNIRISELPNYYKKVFPDFETLHKKNCIAYILLAESYDERFGGIKRKEERV